MTVIESSNLYLSQFLDRSNSARAETDDAPSRTPTTQNEDKPASTLGSGAATVVDLSDRAKAMIAKAKADQAVADRLAAQLQGRSTNQSASVKARTPSESGASDSRADEILSKYGDLPQAATWAAQARTDNIALMKSGMGDIDKWVNFQRQMNAGQEVQLTPGREPNDDEAFANSVYLRVAQQVIDLEDKGETGKAQALRDGFNNGALKIQNTSEVSDLNLQYENTHFADAGGGGTRSSTTLNPTGAVKTALESGDAFWIGGGDRGAFYISW